MSIAKPATNLFATLKQIDVNQDQLHNTLWLTMNYNGRPCMTPEVLHEAEIAQSVLAQHVRNGEGPEFMVLRSGLEDTFNLGGDLAMFLDCIRSGNRERLHYYAMKSIELIYAQSSGLGQSNCTTIALVQGQALGGGFETALANDLIIAEEQATFGFPECTFGMFPGMGAYNFLSRKIAPGLAKQMISSGNTYTARQLFELGVVDMLAPQGEGERTVLRYIERQRQRGGSDRWLNRGINAISEVTFEELQRVVEVWVDASMQLSERNLKLMEFLVAAQRQRFGADEKSVDLALVG